MEVDIIMGELSGLQGVLQRVDSAKQLVLQGLAGKVDRGEQSGLHRLAGTVDG